jgi:hypothetical protein
MSTDEINSRSDVVDMAGALERKIETIYDQNDALIAENDSLRTAFQAVSQENEYLRKHIEKIVRQRDASMRKSDLLEAKMKVVFAESRDCLRAIHPQPEEAPPSAVVFNRQPVSSQSPSK